MNEFLRWLILGFGIILVLVGGWIHSMISAYVLFRNKIPVTRRLMLFLVLPYGMTLFILFVLGYLIGTWLFTSFPENADFEIDLDNLLGVEKEEENGRIVIKRIGGSAVSGI